MTKISTTEIHERYGVEKRTIQKHFQKGRLPGEKDENEEWTAEEEDAQDLYEKLCPLTWNHIDYCLGCSPFTRKEIMDAIDEGLLEDKENFWGLFIHHYGWNKNMMKTSCDYEECCKIKNAVTVTITNKCGIHNRPTALIGKLVLNHPKVELYICHQDKCYNLKRHDLACFLPSLGLGKGIKLTFRAKGCCSKEVIAILRKMEKLVIGGFFVDTNIPVDRLLELIS